MKLRSPLLFLILTVVAGTLSAAPIAFQTVLSGPAEEPPNASPGTGTSLVIFDPVAHTLFVNIVFSGLLAPNTASHIHVINGPGDANTADTLGPVVTATPTFPGFPSGTTAGAYSRTFDTLDAASYRAGFITAAGGIPQAEAALFSGIMEGRAYVNIHTSFAPGGEIRGFLEPVPEPATVGLVGAAFCGLMFARRRFC